MSDFLTSPPLTPLSLDPAITPDMLEDVVGLDASDVKDYLLNICAEILKLDRDSVLWKSTEVARDKVSFEMLYRRLKKGKPTLNSQSKDNKPGPIEIAANKGWPVEVRHRPLEDFEELYYAAVAKIKDICQLLNVRVQNNFANVAMADMHGETRTFNTLFPGGQTLAQAHGALSQLWSMLNYPSFVKPLDDAVRKVHVTEIYASISNQYAQGGISADHATELVEQLEDEMENVTGIAWIGGWAPSMIMAFIEEKYRSLIHAEKTKAQRAADEKARARHAAKARKQRQKHIEALARTPRTQTTPAVTPEHEWLAARQEFMARAAAQDPISEMMMEVQQMCEHHRSFGAAEYAAGVMQQNQNQEQGQEQCQNQMHAFDRNMIKQGPELAEYQKNLEAQIPGDELDAYRVQVREQGRGAERNVLGLTVATQF